MLTLRLRELGGLVRVAAISPPRRALPWWSRSTCSMRRGLRVARAAGHDRAVERRKDYKLSLHRGLCCRNGEWTRCAQCRLFDGRVLRDRHPHRRGGPPAHTKEGGKIVATGKLGEIAKESVMNVSALIKKYTART